uniref:PDZ domain-containing protein n=1 Tax=Macrostomum lignano TaxID=282301 RepID=A0A1I8H658_9PLAT
DAESDHRAHLSAQKKVSHYASTLCVANPRVADDVSAKMRSMQEAWLAVDAALELWPGNGGSLLAREEEIQSRLKALDAVVKVLNRLSDDCEPDDRVAKLMSDAELLRSQFFELLLQLMEAKILLDDEFQQFGRSLRGSVSEAAAAAASVAVPSSSWGAESGFVSELSPTGGGRGAAGLNRTLTEGVHATTDSYDVLPFSEDEYEKISNQSSEPIFALDDLEQRQQAGGRKLPRSADQPSAHRRRRVRDRTAGEQQSRCYYRIMTPADSDDCGQPPDAASDAAAVAVASSSMTTTGTSATPAGRSGGDRQAVEDDSSSSGSKCGISGQKRRFTRSFSPLAVVTRELYVDASALLLGGGSQQQQQQPIPRAASLGAIGGSSSGALSIVMAMETAESETGLAVELLDAGFTSTDSTDGSLADESSIGHSSSPPSPSPAPAPTPTEPMPPPAMSASATATVSYRQSQRGGGGGRSSRRRRSREALLARQSEQRHRLMDARRLACKAERYFTRSAGQLCASAPIAIGLLCPTVALVGSVPFLSKILSCSATFPFITPPLQPLCLTPVCVTASNETVVSASVAAVHPVATATVTAVSSASEPDILVNHLSFNDRPEAIADGIVVFLFYISQDEAEEEAVATNGPEDLDQLWDHYQPQPYAVGVDEAAEERLDDSHLQWEADQQQFESGQDQRQSTEHPDTERELADTVSAKSASLSESESAAGLPLPADTVESVSDGTLLAESRAALADLLAELRRTAACGPSFDADEAALADEAARLDQLAGAARIRLDELNPTSASSASIDGASSPSSSPVVPPTGTIGANLASMRADAEAVESWLRAAASGDGGRLADRIRLLRDSEAALRDWLGQLVDLHRRLQTACGGAVDSPRWLAQLLQCRQFNINYSCGSRLFSLQRAQDRLHQVESAVAQMDCAVAGEEQRLRQCAEELAGFDPASAPRLRVDQLDLLAAEMQICIDRRLPEASQSSVGHCRSLLAGGELSDEDTCGVTGRLSELDGRFNALHCEAARLLNLVNELRKQQQPSQLLQTTDSS